MIDIKYCRGCHDNYYNSPSTSGSSDGMCWSRKSGKIVWRIPIGVDEPPQDWSQLTLCDVSIELLEEQDNG